MLGKKQGKLLSERVSDYCIFDLETTGIFVNSDEVVEISAVKVINNEVAGEFSTLVNPKRPIPRQTSNVNGITDDMVADAPVFEDALKDFLEFAGDLVLVGHNINSFDMKFIYRDAEKFWGQTITNDYIDTLILARRFVPGLGHYTLTDLSSHYGIDPDGAHRALNDCRMNQQLYEHLKKEMENPSKEVTQAPVCPKCGGIMVKRRGPYSEFWGCAAYPKCKGTRNY